MEFGNPQTPPARQHAPIHEEVLRLGKDRTIVAIASEPPAPRSAPAALLVNAGVIHRVGPHRLHVRLARRLAEAGHVAVRMDLSGIGDSGSLPEQLTFRASSVADIRSAIDHLSSNGARTVFVFGVCSGADNALAAAAADPRITGLVLVDPPAYATPQSQRRAVAARLRQPGAWSALPARVLARLSRPITKPKPSADAAEAKSGGRQPPPQAEYGRQLAALADRGVRILSIYTAAQGVRYNHPDQLYEAFADLRGKVEARYFAQANHTFTELAQQAALIETVMEWCGRSFAAV